MRLNLVQSESSLAAVNIRNGYRQEDPRPGPKSSRVDALPTTCCLLSWTRPLSTPQLEEIFSNHPGQPQCHHRYGMYACLSGGNPTGSQPQKRCPRCLPATWESSSPRPVTLPPKGTKRTLAVFHQSRKNFRERTSLIKKLWENLQIRGGRSAQLLRLCLGRLCPYQKSASKNRNHELHCNSETQMEKEILLKKIEREKKKPLHMFMFINKMHCPKCYSHQAGSSLPTAGPPAAPSNHTILQSTTLSQNHPQDCLSGQWVTT